MAAGPGCKSAGARAPRHPLDARPSRGPLEPQPGPRLQTAGGGGLSAMMMRLRGYLDERQRAGECVLLVIDEAQDLNPLVLEQIRLLTNLEAGGHKLLQIILSGQPELSAHLRHSNGRSLDQRIAVRCRLEALSAAETAAYIAARLEQAGATTPLFTPSAMARIYGLTGGVPRLINLIADHCLLAGYAVRAACVEVELVERAGRQLELAPAPARAGVAAAAMAAKRAPMLQRFASGWARWAGLAAGGK
ncbi:MAG: ExeA family protein [Terriglobales bacterium]